MPEYLDDTERQSYLDRLKIARQHNLRHEELIAYLGLFDGFKVKSGVIAGILNELPARCPHRVTGHADFAEQWILEFRLSMGGANCKGKIVVWKSPVIKPGVIEIRNYSDDNSDDDSSFEELAKLAIFALATAIQKEYDTASGYVENALWAAQYEISKGWYEAIEAARQGTRRGTSGPKKDSEDIKIEQKCAKLAIAKVKKNPDITLAEVCKTLSDKSEETNWYFGKGKAAQARLKRAIKTHTGKHFTAHKRMAKKQPET